MGLAPYVCVWLVAREALVVFPDVGAASGMERLGWIAVAFAAANIIVYFAALIMSMIPVVALYIAFQNKMMDLSLGGGIKG